MLGSRKVRAAARALGKELALLDDPAIAMGVQGLLPDDVTFGVALALLHRHRIAPHGAKRNLIANLRLGERFLERAL